MSLFGFAALIGLAWLFSANRSRVSWRVVLWASLMQFVLGALVFWFPPGRTLFLWINDTVAVLLSNARHGAEFLFGDLALPPGTPGSKGFYLAFQALPTVIFFSACTGLLYFFGVLPWVIRSFSRLFSKSMHTSGAESLSVASNVFVGIESALMVRPYLKGMTASELAAVLTAGMATIASTVLGLYSLILTPVFPTIAGHLVSASLLSAPAALLMSKLLLPETGEPETMGRNVSIHMDRGANWIDAITRSAMDGLQLAFGIAALLLSFLALLALANSFLGWIGSWFGAPHLSLELLLSYVFYLFAWIIGIAPADVPEAARLLGLRIVATEVPAYQSLAEGMAGGRFSDPRSAVILAYALCGFAHVPSLGVFVGGIAALEPSRREDIGKIAIRCLVAATLACLMTGAVAGIFFNGAELVLRR